VKIFGQLAGEQGIAVANTAQDQQPQSAHRHSQGSKQMKMRTLHEDKRQPNIARSQRTKPRTQTASHLSSQGGEAHFAVPPVFAQHTTGNDAQGPHNHFVPPSPRQMMQN
jgi:hypothetical protein